MPLLEAGAFHRVESALSGDDWAFAFMGASERWLIKVGRVGILSGDYLGIERKWAFTHSVARLVITPGDFFAAWLMTVFGKHTQGSRRCLYFASCRALRAAGQ